VKTTEQLFSIVGNLHVTWHEKTTVCFPVSIMTIHTWISIPQTFCESRKNYDTVFHLLPLMEHKFSSNLLNQCRFTRESHIPLNYFQHFCFLILHCRAATYNSHEAYQNWCQKWSLLYERCITWQYDYGSIFNQPNNLTFRHLDKCMTVSPMSSYIDIIIQCDNCSQPVNIHKTSKALDIVLNQQWLVVTVYNKSLKSAFPLHKARKLCKSMSWIMKVWYHNNEERSG
jgi:hypothetical protein